MPISAKSLFKRFSSFSRKRQEPPSPPPPPPPPAVFLCPISSLLMADPVVVPTGHSFDRPCIQACRDLNFIPPHLNLNLDLNLDFPLIPNLNFREAIHDWCLRSGHPLPTPISSDSGLHFVRGLMYSPPPPTTEPPPYPSFDPDKEELFLNALNDPDDSVKESSFFILMNGPFCSPRILAAIISFLTAANSSNFQEAATQAISTLAANPANRTHILRSGAVPPLISVLIKGTSSVSASAARALYKLSEDEANRLAIGALGAVPMLLDKFCEPVLSNVGRIEAALALYQLSHCRWNLEVLVEEEGVRRLMVAVTDRWLLREEKRYALILVHCMVGLRRGREQVVKERWWMKELFRMVREAERLNVICLTVLYKICRGSLGRFREAATAAKGEEVLVEEMEVWGVNGKEMAREMVRVMRGECSDGKQLKKIPVMFEQWELMELVEEDEEGGGSGQ